MISTLQAFLIQAAKEQSEKEISVSKRFDQKFRIRALSMDEWEHIQKLSTNPESRERVDSLGMLKRAAIEGCVDPCFKSEEFIKAVDEATKDNVSVKTPGQALCATLNAGEIVKLANAVLKFSGFGESVEEASKEARD